MKKTIEKHLFVSFFALLTTLCLMFAFVGCGEPEEASNGNNESSVSLNSSASDSSGGTQPAVQMTESYAQARTAFTTATGLTLPELETVEGMFEKINETTYMMDINGADETVYSSVTASFGQQTGAEPYVNAYNMDTWDHSRTVEGVTYACQIRSVLDTGTVLIMCYQTAVTESYMTARQNYYEVTGLELPLLGGVEADLDYPYQSGALSYELDIFEGATTDMFATIEKFFDGLSGWTKDEPQSDGEYTNLWYRSAGGSVGVTWDGYNNGLYIHAEMSGVIVASTYAEARQLLNETFGILLPDHENVTLEWNSFAKDGEEVTFGFSRSDFTISDFNDVKAILSEKLGAPTEKNDNGEYGYDVSWISGGYYYSASWDPAGKTIDINITVYNS